MQPLKSKFTMTWKLFLLENKAGHKVVYIEG